MNLYDTDYNYLHSKVLARSSKVHRKVSISQMELEKQPNEMQLRNISVQKREIVPYIDKHVRKQRRKNPCNNRLTCSKSLAYNTNYKSGKAILYSICNDNETNYSLTFSGSVRDL